MTTIVDLITGLISPANVETKVVESKGYPQRITNGSVQKLLDAKISNAVSGIARAFLRRMTATPRQA